MSKDAFRERERALENEFFARVDRDLLADLKAEAAVNADRQKLTEATGIENVEVLDELRSLDVTPEALTALSLVPLILVAWADGKLDGRERHNIVETAHELGVSDQSASAKLLAHWLGEEPSSQLAETWRHCVKSLTENMNAESRDRLHKEVHRRAVSTARASGGFMGVLAVSTAQQRVIDELDIVFAVKTR